MSADFRCATSSHSRAEPLHGTASTVRAFLLVESPGPWGVDALRDGRLPLQVRDQLGRRTRERGVRPLMIRRHGRSTPSGVRVFAAYADADRPWCETATLDHPAQILDLDLASLGAGRSPGLAPHEAPVFLVCTHGRHDVCCAELGRPVAAALASAVPEQTWEVSHIGGDRFAGNVLVLPEGLYYGRLDAASGPAVARQHLAGRLDLDHFRGRCAYPFAVQAAEWMLRGELGLTGLRALTLRSHRRVADLTEVLFDAADAAWRVSLRHSVGDPEQLTCQALRPNPVPAYEPLTIERVD